jgi:hypothetical protein
VEGVELLSLPAVAERLAVPITRVHQALRDGQLVATAVGGTRRVPALLLQEGAVVKSLPSVITQLRDAHFADDDIIEWLFRADDALPGRPIEALRANRAADVRRQAQLAGY